MKLKSLTSKPSAPKQFNDKPKDKSKYIPNVPFSLAASISEKYEGTADNILGVINNLPGALKTFFKDAELKEGRFNHDSNAFRLVDGVHNTYYLIIQELTLGGTPMYYVRMKMNGKLVFRNYVKRR